MARISLALLDETELPVQIGLHRGGGVVGPFIGTLVTVGGVEWRQHGRGTGGGNSAIYDPTGASIAVVPTAFETLVSTRIPIRDAARATRRRSSILTW